MGRRGIVGMVAAFALLVVMAAPGPAAAFGPIASFGSDGEGAGQLSAPGAMAVAPDGKVFVADRGNDRVSVFSGTGDFLYAFGKGVRPGGGDICNAGSGCVAGSGGGEAGALSAPEGIAISEPLVPGNPGSRQVFIAEEENDRVSVFSLAGEFEFAFGNEVDPAGGDQCAAESGCQKGSNFGPTAEPPPATGPKAPAGALGKPTGVTIAESGRLFVAEAENNRVSVLDPLGDFLYAFGVEVNAETFENVCTKASGCIEGFGGFPGGGISKPGGIAMAPGGLLAVSDAGHHRLVLYTQEGELLRAYGDGVAPTGGDICVLPAECKEGVGEGAGSLGEPAGLFVSGGSIYVGDAGLERVSQFTLRGQFIRAFGAGVVDGSGAFQVCTSSTGCRAGIQSAILGATSHPYGVVPSCRDSILVSESTTGLSRLERFGEPDAASPPCVPESPPLVVREVPTNVFRLGRLKRNRRTGTASLGVFAPVAGEFVLTGNGIRRTSTSLHVAGSTSLPVELVGAARRRLVKTGNCKVSAVITFTPNGGSARTEPRKLTLVKQAKPKPRRPR
jgi:DNA-binding beta-propeller fold protein YncE